MDDLNWHLSVSPRPKLTHIDQSLLGAHKYFVRVAAGKRTLSECFKIFDIIHKVTTDHDVISRITEEVLRDFSADNVLYLELRTTPKVRTEYCGPCTCLCWNYEFKVQLTITPT